MNIWKLKNPVYGIDTYLCIDSDHKRFADRVARKFPGCDVEQFCEDFGCCFYVTSLATGRRAYFVWQRWFKKNSPGHLAFLAHEFYHLVRQQLEYLGVKEQEESSEAGAYFMSFMFGQALEILGRSKK